MCAFAALFGPAPLQKCVADFVVQLWEEFAGDSRGGIFWALFPTKMRRKDPATNSVKKSGSPPKRKRKIRSAKKPTLTLLGPIAREFSSHYGNNCRRLWTIEGKHLSPHSRAPIQTLPTKVLMRATIDDTARIRVSTTPTQYSLLSRMHHSCVPSSRIQYYLTKRRYHPI